ncbi:MAG: Holliday junction resolvase RuvX [Candidatus Kerfeldbacteria bacterium]|nr:Holliday junction resolvase RuvX [Candidatus Kerfeldbacteria bacterium]
MKILAIDYGLNKVGLAIGDTITKLAFPRGLLTAAPNLTHQIVVLVKEEEVSLIIVGQPLNMQGQATKQTETTVDFVSKLQELITVPVELLDERLTTKRALGAKQSGSRLTDDELAAMYLLQDYLDRYF